MLLSCHTCQSKQGFAVSKKAREKWREDATKNIDFWTEIQQKPDEKSRKTAFAAKIDKRTLPGTALLEKNRFWVVLGIPGVTQKS